jgi:LuxR family maltose regulon positive regulatory protein
LTVASAYGFRGERAAAGQAFAEALSVARASGNILHASVALIGVGQIQESDNQLKLAAETYRCCFKILGNHQPPPVISEGYLGMARIFYEWNDLDTAEQQGQLGLQLARQYDTNIDIFVLCEMFLALLKLARGDVAGAAAMLAETERSVRERNFILRMPELAAAQVLTLLHQGNRGAAARLAQTQDIPLSQARVLLAQGDPSAALATLQKYRQQMEAKGWADERLKTMIIQSVALSAHGEKDKAVQLLSEALALAEPGGFIRIFVDEGAPMTHLLSEAAALGIKPDYVAKLLAAFQSEKRNADDKPDLSAAPLGQPLREALSQRELEILHLLAQGLSNREIGERLYLALDTIKGHNRQIFGKLQVQRRIEAVARARELGLL